MFGGELLGFTGITFRNSGITGIILNFSELSARMELFLSDLPLGKMALLRRHSPLTLCSSEEYAESMNMNHILLISYIYR